MLPALMLASIRPAAALLAAPVFGMAQVPVILRLILALAIGIPASGTATITLPSEGLASVAGALLIASEIILGLALGFTLQAGFAAASIAGEAIGNAMGLGFAATFDPLSGHGTPAVSQILTILTTLLFLAIDGHLAFFRIVVESYGTLPIGGGLISARAVAGVVATGTAMFAAALTLAMPVVTGVLLIQLVMALLARTAPAMNIFAVGVPAALLGGLVLFAFAAPVIGHAIVRILQTSLDLVMGAAVR